jgi:Bacterial PH domain
MAPIEFRAPWSRSLKITTIIAAAVMTVLGTVGVWLVSDYGWMLPLIMVGGAILVLLTTVPYVVRGYTLTQDEIIIRQLGKITRLRLDDVQSVEGKPDALKGAWRLLASAGIFSYSGWYWSRELKRFHAMASDPSRTVVIRLTKRTLVITPHDPQQFIMRARTLLKTTAHRA